MSGASDRALHAARAAMATTEAGARAEAALVSAHDPTLGLDRSVCLRDVVAFLRAGTYPNLATGGDRAIPGWRGAADELLREFGGT